MYDKSKVEMLEYLKAKDDEIKALNSMVELLRERNEFNFGLWRNLNEEYLNAFWNSKDLERKVDNLKIDYKRMERKLKLTNIAVYIQPIIWSACWLFVQWLLK